jgi:hypothetical protein
MGNPDYRETNPWMYIDTNIRLKTGPILKCNFQVFFKKINCMINTKPILPVHLLLRHMCLNDNAYCNCEQRYWKCFKYKYKITPACNTEFHLVWWKC